MTRILVVDNYDSFVHNLVQYVRMLGAECVVRYADRVQVSDTAGCDGVLISPGPGTPETAGTSVPLVRHAHRQGIPLLGVCLGHQAIAVAYGGSVGQAPELVHGRTSAIHHDGRGVFADLPNPLRATRYHSLAVDPSGIPDVLQITARTDDDVIMGLRHRTAPIEGVQFHPESVLSESGHRLLANWLATCGFPEAINRVSGESAGLVQ